MCQRAIASLAMVAVIAIAGCSPSESVSPTSPPRVTLVTIECDPAVRADVCRAAGEKLLAGSGTLATRAVRLVLRGGGDVDGRCSAEFYDAAGVEFATASIACPEAAPSS